MASPRRETETQAERETQPESGGVFIRYATISDIEGIKYRQDRQDGRMDRQDDKLDTLIAEVAELKTRRIAFAERTEAWMERTDGRFDRLEHRLERIEYKLDKLNARLLGFMVALSIAVIILIIRTFF